MASTRDIQRRIKSVKNTKKITKAMELVSASKMRKAVEAVLKTRSYANLSWLTVINLAKVANQDRDLHRLLNPRDHIKRVGIILITSNRGLCGGFNTSILNKVRESVKKHHYENDKMKVEAEFVLVGKKGSSIYHKFGHTVVAEFPKLDIATEVNEIVPIAKIAIEDYLSGKYDRIMIAYTDFISAANQVPRVKQLLPIDINEVDDYLGVIGKDGKAGMGKEIVSEKQEKYFAGQEYIFEPSAKQVLDEMIPRLIEIQMFQALLESNASEHSARMMAMRNATDAAGDMIDDLTLTYNKARQAAITAEIAEIAGGAAALAE
ncbi:MAG: ATP synthase F1 subunit gamma [Patescibacteria group bacterium]|jgi:F-type H+-transporting ATPase subunit gamma